MKAKRPHRVPLSTAAMAFLERMHVAELKPDALLFAGHSENFLYVSDALRLRGKTVYELSRG